VSAITTSLAGDCEFADEAAEAAEIGRRPRAEATRLPPATATP